MKIYLIFALLEYILLFFITSGINILNYDYLKLKYSIFSFSNKEKENGLNILIKIFFPTIYLIFVSGVLYKLNIISINSNIYYITILYHILNWIIIIVVLNRNALINKKMEIITTFLSIVLSLIIYSIFINKTTDIFVNFDDLKNGIWLAIITFCGNLFIKMIYNTSKTNAKEQNDRIIKYVTSKYRYFKSKYDNIILTDNKDVRYLVYAIMIFENYNRPWIIRKLEYIKFFIWREATLGIMQIKSKEYITNIESVKKSVIFIENIYKYLPKKMKKDKKIEKVLYKYNCSVDYVNEVKYIYELLKII